MLAGVLDMIMLLTMLDVCTATDEDLPTPELPAGELLDTGTAPPLVGTPLEISLVSV